MSVSWVSDKDLKNAVVDNYGVKYSPDGLRLLSAPKDLKNYAIKPGTEVICSEAFKECTRLTSITIPDSVTLIGRKAFYGCSGLTSITIPEKVTSIGDYAFEGCSGLTSITIPEKVTSIGDYAFEGCSSLTSIIIGNSVTSIGSEAFHNTPWFDNMPYGDVYAGKVYYTYKGTMPEGTSVTIKEGTIGIGESAFNGCRGLSSITIPDSVTSIGRYAFSGCSGLTSITIPDSVTSIGRYAFQDCSGLTSITIPEKVTSIGERAFKGCSGLASITVDTSNTTYDSRENCNAIIETNSNTLILGCKNTIIPNSVTSIGEYAFYGCSGLTSVSIPNSVISIGDFAFEECSGLTSIDIPNSVTSIGSKAFHNTPWFDNMPDGDVYAGKVYYTYKGTMPEGTSVTVKEGTIGIAEGAFYGCSGLTSITIPNSVTTIGESAFEGCSGLTSITIPNSVTSIGSWAFYGCTGLTSINIPNSVTSIGNGAFQNCSGLKKSAYPNHLSKPFSDGAIIAYPSDGVIDENGIITDKDRTKIYFAPLNIKTVNIPNSVTEIGKRAFAYCSDLTSITIPDSVTVIGNSAFYGCSGLTSITIPNSVTTIGEYAFQDCTGLTSITIPNSVTKIGESAFAYCRGLTSITIPDSVTSIGDLAFSGCSGLTSITIPDSATSIGDLAFSGCSGLTEVVIPNGVKTIGDDAFNGCSGLTSITIPDSVTSIGTQAFEYCSGLTSVTIGNSVTEIGNCAFFNCCHLTSITVPISVTEIGNSAFSGCNILSTIIFKSKNPPELKGSEPELGVESSPYDNGVDFINILVPEDAVDAYKSHPFWKRFKNIRSAESFIFASALSLDRMQVCLEGKSIFKINATMHPSSANEIIEWSSSNNEIATVCNGHIHSHNVGTAVITAKCKNVPATCIVEVKEVSDKSIEIDKSSLSLMYGDSAQLKAEVKPSEAIDTSIEWSSSDENIVKVENGKIIGVGIGKAFVTAKSKNVSASCRVEVKPYLAEVLNLIPTTVNLSEGDQCELTPMFYPENTTIRQLNWTSSDDSVARVVDGKVTYVSKGMAIITARTTDGSDKSAISVINCC